MLKSGFEKNKHIFKINSGIRECGYNEQFAEEITGQRRRLAETGRKTRQRNEQAGQGNSQP